MTSFKSIFSITALLMAMVSFTFAQDLKIANFRAYDQSGVNVFETPKDDVKFDGIKIKVGGHFAQQFQGLTHENSALPTEGDINFNELVDLGPGFNLATANLNLDVQLADGIRLNLITYLSSRHHPEAWVKGGFVQIDKLPMFKSEALDNIMKYVTVKVGHMEINYGDNHFRRTDNGNAMYNPLVGNYLMDAFSTEIGAEVYVQAKGFLAMAGATNGEIKGAITSPDKRSPALYGKIGYDNEVTEDIRIRLTGSVYHTEKSSNNTLYSGDRGGSRYYMALQPAMVRDWRSGAVRAASEASDFTTGRINPGFRSNVTAVVVNPFIKVYGLELFGTFERAEGKAAHETDTRVWNQLGVEGVYRFLENENLYIAGRYNSVKGTFAAGAPEVSVDRVQAGMGWFVTPNLLVKGEYIIQNYRDFAETDFRHEGVFKGIMIEAVVGF